MLITKVYFLLEQHYDNMSTLAIISKTSHPTWHAVLCHYNMTYQMLKENFLHVYCISEYHSLLPELFTGSILQLIWERLHLKVLF